MTSKQDFPEGKDLFGFGGLQYKNGKRLDGIYRTPGALTTERTYRIVGGSPEIYITFIYRWRENPSVVNITNKADSFGLRLGKNKFILPYEGCEEQFWLDARELLRAVEKRDNTQIDLQDTGLYFLVSRFHPQLLSDKDDQVPFLLFNISKASPIEVTALLSKLLDLFDIEPRVQWKQLLRGEESNSSNRSKSPGVRLLEGEKPGHEEADPISISLRVIADIQLILENISIGFYGFPWSIEDELDTIRKAILSNDKAFSRITNIKEGLGVYKQQSIVEATPILPKVIPNRQQDSFETIIKRDVFLCHRSIDKEYVRSLTDSLQRRGLSTWFDEAEIKWGESIITKISDGIKVSRYVVVCVGKSFKSGNYAKYELDLAMTDEIKYGINKVLPLLLAVTPEEEQSILEQVPSLRAKSYRTLRIGTESIVDELIKLCRG